MKIFVSYSRRDARDFAEQIRRHLTTFNHTIFTDINSIHIGDIWNDIIEDNITNCDIFVILITHGSLVSSHVEKEVLQAQQEHKRIILCVHKNIELRGVGYINIKWGLENIQGIEFSDKYELARDLYLKVEQYENKKAASRPSPQQTEKISTEANSVPLFIKKGRALIRHSKYVEAIDNFDKALATDPKNIKALNGKGDALRHLQRYDDANYTFDMAIAIDATDLDVLKNKGLVLNDLGRFGKAIEYFDKALAIDSEHSRALRGKGSALIKSGNHSEGLKYLDRALAVDLTFQDLSSPTLDDAIF